MERKERIKLHDSMMDIMVKLSEGNPGALHVCMRLLKEGAAIDPLAFAGGLSNLLSLDTNGIYGSRIWVLYKDICGENLANMVALLRAHQLGMVRKSELFETGRDFAALILKIRTEIDVFAPELAVPTGKAVSQ